MILIRKRTLILFGYSLICLSTILSLVWLKAAQTLDFPVFSANTENSTPLIIIDPGHGGEDGGAVSSDGTICESHLNLAVAQRVNDLFRFFGHPTLMTRTEDISIYTEGNTIKARKVSDIQNRVALVNSAESAVLLSIHQNSLPSSPITHGAQAFWNQENGAEDLALQIQNYLNPVINPDRPKKPRPIPESIYLMNHVQAPAVLIECGFLSNREETLQLQESSYQTKLAAAITSGYLRCVSGEEVS
jgi:N-acetylmuramoyl-L-alanine amidase